MLIPDAASLLRIADQYKLDITAFLSDLVRIPSVNGRDPEDRIAQRIQQEADKLGLESRLVALQPDRPNVLVSYGTGAERFALIGHMDTVAEGDPAAWSSPPFAAEIKDGRMLGRGAADNKAGIACGLYTLALLRDLKLIDPAHQQVIVAGVVDEELGPAVRLEFVTCLIRVRCRFGVRSIRIPVISFVLVTVVSFVSS